MRATTVTLAGREYTVRRLPAMRAIAWRKQAQALLDHFPALADAYQAETDNTVRASAELYRLASGVVEALIDCVLAADGALDRDRDYLLENAYEEEFMAAFEEVMLLNAPLSQMAQATPALNGAVMSTT